MTQVDTFTARADTWLNTISVDGGAPITMDTCKGGDNDSTTQLIRAGGMKTPKPIGGQTTVSNLTLDKFLELETDWAELSTMMRAAPGKSRAVVYRQPLDADGNPFGRPLVFAGILKQVIPPESDSMKSEGVMWSVVVTPGGTVG